jgi:GxxExxY protein
MHVTSPESDSISEAIIGAAFEVSNALGAGFLEKVYERALTYELTQRGWQVDQQRSYQVIYKGHQVGEYIPDLLVGGQVLVELKCIERFSTDHVAQCVNYLRATGLQMALLINFQHPRIEWRRILGPQALK